MSGSGSFSNKRDFIQTVISSIDGSRQAPLNGQSRQCVIERLRVLQGQENSKEHKFKTQNIFERNLLMALLRHYGIKPYRYKHQERRTVMARLPRTFVREVIDPQFQELSKILTTYLDQVTNAVINCGVRAVAPEEKIKKENTTVFDRSTLIG